MVNASFGIVEVIFRQEVRKTREFLFTEQEAVPPAIAEAELHSLPSIPKFFIKTV